MTANSMILAAGRGKRMGHLSDTTPKPLTRVNGAPMIDRALDAIDRAKLGPTVVNIHHLADTMEAHLAPRVAEGSVVISDERDALLETGGGVRRALPLLTNGPILIANGDMIWTDGAENTLTRLMDAFDPDLMGALLLAVPTHKALGYDGVGDLQIAPGDGASLALLRGEAPSAAHMFGGLMILKRSAYEGTPEGAWSNKLLFERFALEGRLYALEHQGDWMHVGTPDAITQAEARLRALGESAQ